MWHNNVNKNTCFYFSKKNWQVKGEIMLWPGDCFHTKHSRSQVLMFEMLQWWVGIQGEINGHRLKKVCRISSRTSSWKYMGFGHWSWGFYLLSVSTAGGGMKIACAFCMISLTRFPLEQNGCYFADYIFRGIFREWKFLGFFIKISLKFVPKVSIDNNPALF